jgi:3',5'-cyclic AMP phosphodiesterase CpdA
VRHDRRTPDVTPADRRHGAARDRLAPGVTPGGRPHGAGRDRPDRRRVAALALLAVALLALAGCGHAARPPANGASTLDATLRDPDGDGILTPGPGEPLLDRGGDGKPVRTLATFAQITDAHVRDEESPARIPFLDRFGAPFSSTFRPQEALTLQTLTATVEAVNAQRPDAVVQTGDLADNAQRNELQQAMIALKGGIVHPDSGAPGPSGPQLASDPDPFYYRPDVDAPRHPGLLRAAQRPFRSPGLDAPLHSVLGNHDVLVAGELKPDARTQALATGDKAIVSLDPDELRGIHVPKTDDEGEGGVGSIGTAAIERVLATGRTQHVAPDPDRREVTPAQARAITGAKEVEAFDIGPVRALALDLNRPEGGSGGRVSPAQLTWLGDQLDRAGDRPVVVFTHQPLAGSENGGAALALLRAHRNVLAAIAGHTHRNEIRRDGRDGPWLITTASLADFPEQARMFRVVALAGGGYALETWMVDHGDGPGGLAEISRELAFLDAQGGRPQGFAGTRLDRNVRLYR